MRVFCAALIIASLTGAAYAQEDNHIQRYGEKDKEKSQTEINQDKAAARAYQNSLNNIPDAGSVDPGDDARRPRRHTTGQPRPRPSRRAGERLPISSRDQ